MINLTKPIIAALILVILVMAFGWLRSCEKAKEIVTDHNDTEFLQEIAVLKRDTTDLRAQLRQKAIETTQDSTSHAKVVKGLQVKITQLRAKEPVLRGDVQVLIDSIPKLQAFVQNQDSTIREQSEVIDELNASYKAQVKGLNEQIEINGQIQAKNDEIMRLYEERIAKLMKQSRKEQRGKRFWRSAAVVLAATTAVLILGK